MSDNVTFLDALIQAHGPIMAFHHDEKYFPDDPEWALDHDTVLAWLDRWTK